MGLVLVTSCDSDQVLEPAISAGESTTCALRGSRGSMGDGRIAVDCFMGSVRREEVCRICCPPRLTGTSSSSECCKVIERKS